MKISQLSVRTGVTLATLKMYLREGLLPPGQKAGPNQADYTEVHVARVRMLRALLRVGGLSVASAREVVAAVESGLPLSPTFAVAQRAATPGADLGSVHAHGL